MELQTEHQVEQVTMSEILELATWDRKRTTDELLGFIAHREAQLDDSIEL